MWRNRLVEVAAGIAVVLATAGSAVAVKELGSLIAQPAVEVTSGEGAMVLATTEARGGDQNLEARWFNGRRARVARTIMMKVTAYSPDARSCGDSADGLTATMHPVTTNGGSLVAADQRVLPYGTMLSVPGYDEGRIVPVLDCGGAIKGDHIDVLFPTHEAAMEWGVKMLPVTVWEYADGQPAEDVRSER
jgi:3D (Asp-Asp-Asp) domain-containing protein